MSGLVNSIFLVSRGTVKVKFPENVPVKPITNTVDFKEMFSDVEIVNLRFFFFYFIFVFFFFFFFFAGKIFLGYSI